MTTDSAFIPVLSMWHLLVQCSIKCGDDCTICSTLLWHMSLRDWVTVIFISSSQNGKASYASAMGNQNIEIELSATSGYHFHVRCYTYECRQTGIFWAIWQQNFWCLTINGWQSYVYDRQTDKDA